jgi:hypothetical protein
MCQIGRFGLWIGIGTGLLIAGSLPSTLQVTGCFWIQRSASHVWALLLLSFLRLLSLVVRPVVAVLRGWPLLEFAAT